MFATAVLRAECAKIRSARGQLATLATALVVVPAVGALVNALYGAGESRDPGYDATALAFYGVNFGQLAVIAFGVIAVGSEYSSGTIRTSLTAVPRRGLFLGAKLTAVFLTMATVGLITSAITFAVTQALAASPASVTDPGVPRAIVGAAVYLALLALFSAAVTFVLRGQVVAITVLMPVFFLVAPLLASIAEVRPWVKYLPDQAGAMIMHVRAQPGMLPPWIGLATMTAWVGAAIIAAWASVRLRDA